MKNFNNIGVPWKTWFLKGGSWKTNIPKRGLGHFEDLRRSLVKNGGAVFDGSLILKSTLWWKTCLSIFPKMPSEIFCSKNCWQNSAKTSFMYQQWTASVLIFLKVSTTDYLVFFYIYISITAILTQASVITC